MSKEIDKLLTRANAFEKLAMYSDRKSFLKAIAQTYEDAGPEAGWAAIKNKEFGETRTIPAPRELSPELQAKYETEEAAQEPGLEMPAEKITGFMISTP